MSQYMVHDGRGKLIDSSNPCEEELDCVSYLLIAMGFPLVQSVHFMSPLAVRSLSIARQLGAVHPPATSRSWRKSRSKQPAQLCAAKIRWLPFKKLICRHWAGDEGSTVCYCCGGSPKAKVLRNCFPICHPVLDRDHQGPCVLRTLISSLVLKRLVIYHLFYVLLFQSGISSLSSLFVAVNSVSVFRSRLQRYFEADKFSFGV